MPASQGGSVLVVDDSPDSLRMLTDALEDAGMTVLVALDGRQALAVLDRITPDVILLDAVMPGVDGFECCRRIKRDRSLAHIPVIFMTGLADTGDIVRGLEAGGVDYVTKPVAPDELLARIRVHLANARRAQSARAALDASGRHLLAADASGRMLWSTPQAATLLGSVVEGFAGEGDMLPPAVRAWLDRRTRSDAGLATDPVVLNLAAGASKLRLSFVGELAPNEVLLRLSEGEDGNDKGVLEARLQLTPRESEVLMWISRGKSNRDIAEILTLSPRTVNKHLEQIYAKLGVENRAAAAALAVRTLGVS